MWIQMIGVLLLLPFHFTTAVNDEKLVMTAPSEYQMRSDLIDWLNEPRRYLVHETLASDLKWLKWDRSLEWLARKQSCETSIDSEFVQVRLRLTERTIGTSEYRRVSDLWSDIREFAEHINEKGAEIDDEAENPLFEKYYDFFRKDWSRVGCAFKTCTNGMTREETNLICLLGPKSTRVGPIFEQKSQEELCDECRCVSMMCTEKRFTVESFSDDEFKKKMLDEFNDGRREFAKRVGAARMNKLIWSETLADSASERGNECPTELEHTSEYKEINADLYVDYAAGLRALGDMYGSTTGEEVSSDGLPPTAFYTIFSANTTEIGCFRTTDCPIKVLCHFRIGEGQKLYEKGEVCSKCSASCEDGLCTE